MDETPVIKETAVRIEVEPGDSVSEHITSTNSQSDATHITRRARP